jgi:hypothetical protein
MNGHTMNHTRTPTLPRTLRHVALSTALCGAALALAACATTPPPTAQMAVSNAALAHAVSAGSAEFAPVEMTMAREKMTRANAALAAKHNDEALALAQQAQVDAQLAEAKAESAKARKSADALQQAASALREEMARKSR